MSQSSPLPKPTRLLPIKHYFCSLKDPRRRHRRVHRLLDIITIAICAVLAGADDWPEIATFGEHRHNWLKRFLALPGGIPSHDTFERVFDALDPQAFAACFTAWMSALCTHLKMLHLAIDGKTLRHSGSKDLGPLHVVSAWATANHLVLAQQAVAEKSNEITAIPLLLEVLDLEGALVTIDAMGCQKEIARQIVERGGDYVLAVKDNQPSLAADVQELFGEVLVPGTKGLDCRSMQTKEKGHGRTEKREYHVVEVTAEFAARHPEWKDLRSVGMVLSERWVGEQGPSYEARYYISSLKPRVRAFARAVRGHWGIENSLHWHMDVSFGEDKSRIRKRHAAENFAGLRRLALGLLKQHPAKKSIKCKRLAAALNSDFLEEILQSQAKIENV